MKAHLSLAAILVAAPLATLAEAPRVAADIAPVHSLVARVMEGVGEPALILRPGASPHDHALRPSEAAVLQEADALIWMGEALTPWLGGAIGTLAPDARVLALMEAEGTTVLPARDEALLGGHEHGHEHGEADPHAWLDPENGRAWLGAVAEALAEIDPANAAAYRANAEAGRAELDALAAEIDAALEPFRGTPYVVLHDAYQYFEARFDVPALGAVAIGDATPPGPARLAAIREAVAERGAACAFAEPQLDPGLLAAATEGSEVTLGVIDPLGASLEPGPALYPRLLRGVADAMLGCF